MAAVMGSLLGNAALALSRPLQPLMPRMVPQLVVIGAQKAGTTTLHDVLAQHTQVVPPRVKEVSFFNREESYARGMDFYKSFFPRRPLFSKVITFDASPMYLYNAHVAERIAKHLPHALCVAILRDPVERAYSAWNMYHGFKDDPRRGHLFDPRSFEVAVEEELAGKQDQFPGRRYLERSIYMPQLQRYLQHLGADRLHLDRFERWSTDPSGLVNDILARLGLSRMPANHSVFSARSNARRYAAPLDPLLAERLRAYFAEDAQLTERICRELARHAP